MAYDASSPYGAPRHPAYQQNAPDSHYSNAGYPASAGQRLPPRHYTSQPHGLNDHFDHSRGERGGPARGFPGRGRGSHPNDLFPRSNGPDGGIALSDRMASMKMSGAAFPSGAVQRSTSGPTRGNHGPGQMALRDESGHGLQGKGRGPPPLGRGLLASRGRATPNSHGYPPGRMPTRQNTTGSYDQGWSEGYDDYSYTGDGQYHWEGPVQEFEPPQRSMTMPASASQPQQYMAYNPSIGVQATPNSLSAVRAESYLEDQIVGLMPNSQWPRQSVNALIDAYKYEDPEYLEGYETHLPANGIQNQGSEYQQSPANFSRPVNRSQPIVANPYRDESAAQPDFALQAHRSKSQPNMRERAMVSDAVRSHAHQSPYDGTVEIPPETPPVPNAYLPPTISPTLRLGPMAKPFAGVFTSQQSRIHPQPVASADDLPHHPTPSFDSSRHSNPDSLPAHPPPVRPGLMHNISSGSSHPLPMRQYSPERKGSAPSKPVEEAPVTQAELSQLQHAAKMNTGDNKLQLTLAKKLVEAAAVLASESGKADIKTTRKNRESYISDAHKIVKRLASGSHPYPDAMFYLATCYGEGILGLQVDHERAFNLYQSAAKMNHPPAAYRTAVCCELGAGPRKDPLKAMTWYKKAASLGETPAMFKLGMILLKGLLGQTRNPREGLNWLKRAADQADENNQHALHELGLLYEGTAVTDIVVPDLGYARELFVRAAELNYPASQLRLGCAYEYGTMGCQIDPRKSIFWYSKAAMTGDLESQLALSGWYLTGAEGVLQQSDTEAYLWARKAAEKGLAKAEYALGYYTEVGIGVPANLDEAKRWYYKAASQQHPKAQQRLQELKKGGVGAQKSRERLSRSNAKQREDGDCVIM